MKMKKSIINFLICAALALPMISIPVSGSANSDIIFDLDVENLADRSGNNVQITQVGTITKGSFTNETGETVPYMTTGNGNDIKNSSKAGTLKIADSSIVGLTDYTIEAWIRYKEPTDNSLYPKIFKHTDYTNTLFAYEMPNDSGADAIMVGSKKPIQKVTNSAELSGTWAHYVFTFDTIYEGDTAISIRPNIYVNGVSLTKDYQTVPEVTDSAALAMLGKAKEFSIGGQTNNGAFHTAFSGDFAEFRIYSSIKSDSEIASMYSSSVDKYTETNVSPSGVRFEDGGLVSGAENVSLTPPNILIDLDNDVNISTVNEDTIRITDEIDGLPVSYSVKVNGTQAVISIMGSLHKNKRYVAEITKGVLKNNNTPYGRFRAIFKTIRGAYANDEWKIEKSDNIITASVIAESDNTSGDFARHILSVYQVCENYVLPVSVKIKEATVTNSEDLSLSADISGLPAGEYKAISILCGEDLEIYENQPNVLEFTID